MSASSSVDIGGGLLKSEVWSFVCGMDVVHRCPAYNFGQQLGLRSCWSCCIAS